MLSAVLITGNGFPIAMGMAALMVVNAGLLIIPLTNRQALGVAESDFRADGRLA